MIRSRPTLLFVAVSLLTFACDGPPTTSPVATLPSPDGAATASAPGGGAGGSHHSAAKSAPTLVHCTPRGRQTASGTFGPSGGTLRLGPSSLTIPEGALGARVTITATVTDDSSSTIDFKPDGLRFRKAASLVISSAGCHIPAGASPAVVYLGTSGDVRETIEANFESHARRVTAPIQHFSGYAIAF